MRAAICARMNSSKVLRWVAIALALWPAAILHAQPVPANREAPGREAPGKEAPAAAQPDPKQPALRAAYDAAFQATMDKPSDPAVLLTFAKIAVEFGDIEGAISALERLLLIDGDQPEVKLELGVLYYRLGSIETAQAYLEEARKSDSATDDIRKRAETFLKEGVKPSDVGKR